MNKPLYPLNALRAFEASARHLSFVKASEELHVTPAALSHQVKKLEDHLGTALFQRLTRGLLLTETGQVLRLELTDIFERLDKAMERVRTNEIQGALTISVAPMFSVKWLFPRLQNFETQHPDLDLRISSSLSVIDFRRDAFDAAIRLGRGDYPGLETIKLFDEEVTPMCSPRLLEGRAKRLTPASLKRFVLLHDDSLSYDPQAPTWTSWLKAAKISFAEASRGPRFDQPDHTIQAAIDGAGFALGWRRLAKDDLAAGRLIEPFDLALPLGSSFYLTYPAAHATRPNIRRFKNWILSQQGGD